MGTATAEIVTRVFVYNGKRYSDPDAKLSSVMALKKLAEKHIEFINAELSGPKHENGELVYTITKTAGTKG